MTPEFAWHPEAWGLWMPFLVLTGTALVIMTADLFIPRGRWNLLALLAVGVAAWQVAGHWGTSALDVERALGDALHVDRFAVFLQLLILGATGLSLLLAESYSRFAPTRKAEFPVLVLFSATGMMLIAGSGDLLTIFLGLEVLSFPTYVLCGFLRRNIKSNEAALKYFVMGSFASSILLYGIAFLWGAAGSTGLRDIAAHADDPMILVGSLLVLVGFLFKVGAVPFHMWVPDVYEGAPTPVTAFMATAVKVAAFGALLRVVFVGLLRDAVPFAEVFWWVAAVSMIVGNLSALTQDNIKRMLAFSSVAHAGYMMIGLAAWASSGSPAGGAAVLYYLLAYAFMNLGAFTVVVLLGRRAEGDLQFERDWSGAARRFPFLGAAMVVFMIALGGLPPTAGFFAKYSLFRAGLDAGMVGLVVFAVINSVISVYYYLRVVVTLYMKPERVAEPVPVEGPNRTWAFEGPGAMAAEPTTEAAAPAPRLATLGGLAARLVVVLCLLGTLWFGLGPDVGRFPGLTRMMHWAETAVAAMR